MSDDLERLLRVGVKAVRSGNTAAARGLFRALAREYPHDPRVWLGLAASAGDRDEQRYALEQVLALDPQNVSAHNGLARLDAALPPAPLDMAPATLPPPPPPQPAPAAAPPPPAEYIPEPGAPVAQVEVLPSDTAANADRHAGHFPLLNRIALGLMALLGVLLLALILWPRLPAQQQAAPPAPTSALPSPNPAPTEAGQPAAALPTNAPVEPTNAPVEPTNAPTSEPTLAAPTAPAVTPTPATLPLGAVLEVDGWRATLLRPDYALLLDGAIGELQPNGRFVLALMAVSNGAAEPRTLPADMFTLTDNAQRTYAPLPGASAIYLATYGGEYGDQALDEPFAAQSGMLSIPVLFDIPPDAQGLVLTMRTLGGAGWPITGGDTSGVGP
jgi:hypothetical protein